VDGLVDVESSHGRRIRQIGETGTYQFKLCDSRWVLDEALIVLGPRCRELEGGVDR